MELEGKKALTSVWGSSSFLANSAKGACESPRPWSRTSRLLPVPLLTTQSIDSSCAMPLLLTKCDGSHPTAEVDQMSRSQMRTWLG